MTNGAGSPHHQARGKKAAGKKVKGTAAKSSSAAKRWIPAGLARKRQH
jgi:hypothetical protein